MIQFDGKPIDSYLLAQRDHKDRPSQTAKLLLPDETGLAMGEAWLSCCRMSVFYCFHLSNMSQLQGVLWLMAFLVWITVNWSTLSWHVLVAQFFSWRFLDEAPAIRNFFFPSQQIIFHDPKAVATGPLGPHCFRRPSSWWPKRTSHSGPRWDLQIPQVYVYESTNLSLSLYIYTYIIYIYTYILRIQHENTGDDGRLNTKHQCYIYMDI